MQTVRGTISKVLNPTVMQTPAFIDGVSMPERVCFGVRRGGVTLNQGGSHPIGSAWIKHCTKHGYDKLTPVEENRQKNTKEI